jgi:hypothetical protein
MWYRHPSRRSVRDLALACLSVALMALAGAPQLAQAAEPGPATRPAAEPSQRFGMNSHLRHYPGNTKWMPLMAAAGVSMFRDNEEWHGVERERGVYKLDPVTERMIDEGRALGMEPLFILGYENKLYENILDTDGYIAHALWLMDHFKGRIKYWQVWNEPMNFWFRKVYGGAWNGKEKDGSDSPWVKEYAAFITKAARALKAAHPEAILITGTSGPADLRLLGHYPEMWEHIDVLAIHPYPYRLPPELQPYGGEKLRERDGVSLAGPDHSFASMIGIYRDALKKLGKPDMPIWVTEVGYTTGLLRKPNGPWAGMTEQAQAIYNSRFGILSASLGVDKTFFFCLLDYGDDPYDTENRFGFLRRDGSPRPAYHALARLCRLMPGDTRPQKVNVKLTRLAPFPRTDSTQWDAQTIEFLDEPQIHTFRRPDGGVLVCLWRAGRIYADYQDELSDVEIELPEGVSKVVEAGRLVSGEELPLKSEVSGATLRLREVPFASEPIYLLLR